MFYLLAAVLILLLFYLLALQGRRPGFRMQDFQHCLFAHRGLYGGTVPENSLAAFRRAIARNYGIELDLHLLQDGNVAVLHDSRLARMTGRPGILENLSTADLQSCYLNGTKEAIPTLSQVLNLVDGRVPLILELKTHDRNAARLTQTVCRMLDAYHGSYCLESFDPRCLLWLKKHRPQILRGQLSENFLMKKDSDLSLLLRFGASYHLESFLTRPDFIAHKYEDRKTLSNFLIRRFWKIPAVTWTVHSQQELDTALQEGYVPIFEGFLPKDT